MRNAPDNQPSRPIRLLEAIASKLSYRALYRIAYVAGSLSFYCSARQRKRTMGNLGLAHTLGIDSRHHKRIARQSLINLNAVTLDYLKIRHLQRQTSTSKVSTNPVHCENPELIEQLTEQSNGVIIVTGHQANWELTMLEISSRLPGAVISQRFFVDSLADWIDSIRTQFGGELIRPKHAVRRGLKVLKSDRFAATAIDQALPEGGLPIPCFGTRAYTTTTPAIWALRTGCPIVMLSAQRTSKGYSTRFHAPIWADQNAAKKEEIRRLTEKLQSQLEDSIRQQPEDYLWLHNRYQQHHHRHLKPAYRHDVILMILPANVDDAANVASQLDVLNAYYPRALLTLMIPEGISVNTQALLDEMQIDVVRYHTAEALMIDSWRFQMVFHYGDHTSISRYYRKRGAFEVIPLLIDKPLDAQLTSRLLIDA